MSSVCSGVVSQGGSGNRSQPCTQASEKSPSNVRQVFKAKVQVCSQSCYLSIYSCIQVYDFNIHILNGNDFCQRCAGVLGVQCNGNLSYFSCTESLPRLTTESHWWSVQ